MNLFTLARSAIARFPLWGLSSNLIAIFAMAQLVGPAHAGDPVTVGANVTFYATADGSPAPTFHWRKNGAPITGATGQLGQLALSALKARDPETKVIALARDPAKISDTEARAFDYTKPETLAAGLQGVSTVVLISSNDFNDRAGQHRAVIDAAKAAGIARGVALEAYRAVHRRGEWLPWMAPPPPAPVRCRLA